MKQLNKKILGASGYIGKFIFERHREDEFYEFYSRNSDSGKYFDLASKNFDLLKLDNNSIIIFLSSISSPDICKNNYALAKKINLELTSELIEYALRKDSKIIFFSSDTVYGEVKIPTKENEKLIPVGNYGEMKCIIEKKFLGHENFKSIRLSYVFSYKDKFSNYIKNISFNNKIAQVYHPLFRNVVSINDVLEGIEKICNNWSKITQSSFNFGGPELISRKDIASYLKSYVYNTLKYEIIKPEKDFYSARPKYIALDITSFKELLGRQPLSISKYIKLNKENF